MALFTSILDKLGVRLDKQETEVAKLREKLADHDGKFAVYDARIDAIEKSLETVVTGYEERYALLQRQTLGAKRQSQSDLAEMRKEIDIFVEIVELSAEAQLDETRRRRVAKLLKSARTKRTRIDNLLARRAANDAA